MRGNYFFVEKKKNGEGKEGNYNGKGKIVAGRVDGRVKGSIRGLRGHKKCLPNRRAIFVCSRILSPCMAEQDMSSLQCNLQRLNLDNGSIIGSMVVSF